VDGFVVDVDDVVSVVEEVDPGVDVDVVVEGETGVAGEMTVGVCRLELDVDVVVVVDVVDAVGAVPVSAETQPDGGVEAPVWPGIKTVPAHPKFANVASSVTVAPSEKLATGVTSRMKPAPSMATFTVVPV
jgi:hypothetical protein